MKKPPTRSNVTVLKQLLNHIPLGTVNRVARETGVDGMARVFTVFSHLATMLFGQLSHAIGLNDVCDWMRLRACSLKRMGVSLPNRNTLSHANKMRPAQFMERLFWEVLGDLRNRHPSFAHGRRGRGLLHRFRVNVHVVDSTVMELVANCMDWAKHRRRKAAAKMHLRMELHSFLPTFAIVDTAKEHDNKRARELCAGLADGEVVVFDKAHIDFEHLTDLDARGVLWVTRAKENMHYRVCKNLSCGKKDIVKDQLVSLSGQGGMKVRRVEAWVKVDEEDRLMVCKRAL